MQIEDVSFFGTGLENISKEYERYRRTFKRISQVLISQEDQ